MRNMFRIGLAVGVVVLTGAPIQAHGVLENLEFQRYVRPFYDRYSKHFDQHGLQYAAPSYGIADFSPPGLPRDWIMTAMAYRWRAAEHDPVAERRLYRAAEKTAEYFLAEHSSQSFADSQGAFLLLRYIEEFPWKFSTEEREKVLTRFAQLLPLATVNADTENRAIIRATNWTFILDSLRDNQIISDQQFTDYSGKFQSMLDLAISDTVTVDGWYREGKNFTPHYHAVAAFHILWYGRMTGQPTYSDLAERMYHNLKAISFQNGLIEANFGHRPPGMGVQFYLMLGIIGSSLHDPEAGVYFAYGSGNRFFSDRKFPNRLEFHRTQAGVAPQFHDDIAFLHVAEAGLVMPDWQPAAWQYRFYRPPGIQEDSDFRIINTGRIITVTDKLRRVQQKYVLGLNGGSTWKLR